MPDQTKWVNDEGVERYAYTVDDEVQLRFDGYRPRSKNLLADEAAAQAAKDAKK